MSKALATSFVLFLTAIGPEVAYAQTYSGGCFVSPAKLNDAEIASFLSAPGSIATGYPVGGFEMVGKVRALSGSSADTLDPMLALVEQLNTSQKAALGTGLARVARVCAVAAPEYAQLIQEKVAATNSPDVTTSFLSTLNEVQTAALGAGAGAGGAGAGGVGGGAAGDSSGGLGGDSTVATTAGDFTVGSRSRRLITNITNENSGTSPF